jgi:hypothetical protein
VTLLTKKPVLTPPADSKTARNDRERDLLEVYGKLADSVAKNHPYIAICGDTHTSIAAVIKRQKDSDNEIAYGNRDVDITAKYTGSVTLEAKMLSLATPTFPRTFLDANLQNWRVIPLTQRTSTAYYGRPDASQEAQYQVLGPTLQNFLQEGYSLEPADLYQELYEVERLDRRQGIDIYRRKGSRSVRKPRENHSQFRPLTKHPAITSPPRVILLNVDGQHFLTDPAEGETHARELIRLCGDAKPWVICKFRSQELDIAPSALEALTKNRDKYSLCLVINADDIRLRGRSISRAISWERTVQETIARIEDYGRGSATGKPRVKLDIVVVCFSMDAALVGQRIGDSYSWAHVYDPAEIEGDFSASVSGTTRGVLSTVASSLAHCFLLNPHTAGTLSKLAIEYVRRGLVASRLSHRRGLTLTRQSSTGGKELAGIVPVESVSIDSLGPFAARDGAYALPTDVMSEVIRSGHIRAITWIPDVPETEETRVRFKAVTRLLAEDFKRASELVVSELDEATLKKMSYVPGTGNVTESVFDSTWWSLIGMKAESYGGGGWLELAKQVLIFGPASLNRAESATVNGRDLGVPMLQYGNLIALGRAEIETYRDLHQLFRQYAKRDFVHPLNIGVFGEPGSGKTFAIKEIMHLLAKAGLLSEDPITKDVSQFASDEDLDAAFRHVANECLAGKVPVVFWDEYDANKNGAPFGWLQSFLEPMQARQHSSGGIGRSVFVFAGSRFRSSSELRFADLFIENDWTFDLADTSAEAQKMRADASAAYQLLCRQEGTLTAGRAAKFGDWAKSKGRDFKSRLTRSIDVIGVNEGGAGIRDRETFLLKRALLIRGVLYKCFPELFEDQSKEGKLSISEHVCNALLSSDVNFVHGARSLETILRACGARGAVTLNSSHLPSEDMVAMHVKEVSELEKHYRAQRG